MAWNDPGGGKDKDPWSGDDKNKNTGKNTGGGPPDLDEIWRRLRAKLSGGRNGSGRGGSGGSGDGISGRLIAAIVGVAIVIWLFTGLYVIQPGEKGVVLRFGEYVETVGPGWHWRPPYPVGMVLTVDTQEIRNVSIRGVMLTQDQNYVAVKVAVQYRVANAMAYLFNLQSPDTTVRQTLRSVVRQIVGGSALSQVLQGGVGVDDLKTNLPEEIAQTQSEPNKAGDQESQTKVDEDLADEVKKKRQRAPEITQRSRAMLDSNIRKLMTYRLDKYQAGVKIVAVAVQSVQPPEPVQGAFEETVRARAQKAALINEARAYARALIARTEGERAQRIAQAKAYKQRVSQRARGNAARFTKVAEKYAAAPAAVRTRLYLETMGDVLADSHLILDNGGEASVNYLPLGQLLNTPPAGKQTKPGADDSPAGSKPNPGSRGAGSTGLQGMSDGMGASGAQNSRNRNRSR